MSHKALKSSFTPIRASRVIQGFFVSESSCGTRLKSLGPRRNPGRISVEEQFKVEFEDETTKVA